MAINQVYTDCSFKPGRYLLVYDRHGDYSGCYSVLVTCDTDEELEQEKLEGFRRPDAVYRLERV